MPEAPRVDWEGTEKMVRRVEAAGCPVLVWTWEAGFRYWWMAVSGGPDIYGLTAFGQEGVERVLNMLAGELRRTMQQCGTPAIRDITRAAVKRS